MDTSEKVLNLIAEKGITKKEFALAIGVTPSTVSEWKSGRQSVMPHISKIADYFDVSVDYLLGREEIKIKLADSDMSYETFREEFLKKGITDKDFDNLTEEQKNAMFDLLKEIIKNFKK